MLIEEAGKLGPELCLQRVRGNGALVQEAHAGNV